VFPLCFLCVFPVFVVFVFLFFHARGAHSFLYVDIMMDGPCWEALMGATICGLLFTVASMDTGMGVDDKVFNGRDWPIVHF
jgi:hypothetical protein